RRGCPVAGVIPFIGLSCFWFHVKFFLQSLPTTLIVIRSVTCACIFGRGHDGHAFLGWYPALVFPGATILEGRSDAAFHRSICCRPISSIQPQNPALVF